MKEDILRHIKRGDQRAFREVFDNYFHALAAFAFKYIEDKDITEDVVQEVFISFWEKRKDFNHLPALQSFLYTSVRNRCLNYLKHEKVKKKHEGNLIYELESDHLFSGRIISEEVFNRLYIQVKDLPAASREIMLLTLNGLKNQEIADELGISINTVKTQKKIAYAKIKEQLGPVLGAIVVMLIWVQKI